MRNTFCGKSVFFILSFFFCIAHIRASQEVDYVIAHYEENLDWVRPYADRAYIYHKGHLQKPAFPSAYWRKLPNVGREGHTYLYHIVNNYDRLADITFFLQGRIDDHMHGKSLDQMAQEVAVRGISFLGYTLPVTTYCDFGRLSIFWRAIFGVELQPGTIFYTNGCFAVSKEKILSYPKGFYRRMLSCLSKDSNPEEGFFLERMWYFMFDPYSAENAMP